MQTKLSDFYWRLFESRATRARAIASAFLLFAACGSAHAQVTNENRLALVIENRAQVPGMIGGK